MGLHRNLPATAVCFLLLASCAGEQAPAASPPEPQPSAGDEHTEVPADQQMWHHFWDIIRARDAIIGARLSEVGPPMARIAAGEFGMDVPADWRSWIEEMQAQAAQASNPASLAEAAVAVSKVAGACADCHRTTGGGPNLEGDTRGYKPDGTGLHAAMARHTWAAEELWLGMTAPRHEAWMRGATALASMELPQDQPAEAAEADEAAAAAPAQGGAAQPAAGADEPATAAPAEGDPNAAIWKELEKMRELGKRAEEAAQPSEKTAIYAEMLTQCAGCHSAAGVR